VGRTSTETKDGMTNCYPGVTSTNRPTAHPCLPRRPSSSLARPNFKDGAIRHPIIEEGLHQCRCLRLRRRAPRAQRQRWRLHTCLRRDSARERLLFEHNYFLHMREYASCVFFATFRQNKRVLRRDSGVLSGATADSSLLTRRPFGSPPPGQAASRSICMFMRSE